jgi:hypothetical protein
MTTNPNPRRRKAAPTATPTAVHAAAYASLFREHAKKPALRVDLTVPFADGLYRFLLTPKEMEELQLLCGSLDRSGNRQPVGIFAIYGRLSRGRLVMENGDIDWNNLSMMDAIQGEALVADCAQVIRLGLIGGDKAVVDGQEQRVPPARARQLVDQYVLGRPIEEAWTLAFAILGARIGGRKPDASDGE